MKKKIILMLAMVAVLALTLAFAVSAESVHEGKVDLDATATVTLGDSTQEVNLFDAEGNALIWYYDKSGTLQSVRADLGVYDENGELKTDNIVDFRMSTWNSTIYGVLCNQVNGIYMTIGGESYGASDIVVFNIMDDDVNVTTKNDGTPYAIDKQPVFNCITSSFKNATNIQYAFLRLDFAAIQGETFSGATNLKYVNVADLAGLVQIGGGSVFNNCTSLFKGQTLDLSGTSIKELNGSGIFNKVPMTGIILPACITSIGHYNFQETALTTFTFPNTTVKLSGDSHFKNCRSLTAVYGLEDLAITSLPGNMFLNCSSLTEIKLPSGLEKLGGSCFNGCTVLGNVTFPSTLEEIGGQCFSNCKAITEVYIPSSVKSIGSDCWRSATSVSKVTFAEDCKITALYAHTFDGCIFEEIKLPNTLLRVGQNCFNNSNLKKIILGASFVDFNASNAGQPPFNVHPDAVYYFPATFTAAAVRNGVFNWSDVPSNKNELKTNDYNMRIFYTGTKAAAEAILLKARTGGTDGGPLNEFLGSMELMSIDEYNKAIAEGTLVDGVKNAPRRYFVYGYNHCDAFYDGKHAMSGNAQMLPINYVEDIKFADVCTRKECGNAVIDESLTMDAIFTYYGYSCTEEAIGGVYSMSQFYGVNNEALDAYKSYTGKSFAYGLVASGSANPLSIVEGELTVANKAFTKDSETFAHSFFGIKINGMTEENLKTAIVFCAYVVDGDEISYLDNDTTTKTVAGITYENVLVIVNTPADEEEAE